MPVDAALFWDPTAPGPVALPEEDFGRESWFTRGTLETFGLLEE